jgi:hypothetical protein
VHVLERLDLENGPSLFQLVPERLTQLLRAHAAYRDLDGRALEELQRRIDVDVQQAVLWTQTLNGMALSPQQKEAAMRQLVENLAANHTVNALVHEAYRAGVLPATFRPDTLREGLGADDWYTLFRQLER